MYMIANKKDKTMHWCCALDEGYEPYPHINLTICLKKQVLIYKVPVRKNPWEARAIANMLRDTADSIERQLTGIQARMNFWKQENGDAETG